VAVGAHIQSLVEVAVPMQAVLAVVLADIIKIQMLAHINPDQELPVKDFPVVLVTHLDTKAQPLHLVEVAVQAVLA
jgi:hypothetical protein